MSSEPTRTLPVSYTHLLETPEQIRRRVRTTIEENIGFGGFGLGCGNSIPDYIPVEGFFAMNEAANEFRLSQLA